MASETTIRDMLTFFTQLGYPLGGTVKEIIDSWVQALSKYPDDQVKQAVFRCIDDGVKFITPGEITVRVKASAPPLDLYESHECRTNCTSCGKWRWCRRDTEHPRYQCEDCYTGLNKELRRQRYRDLMVTMGWVKAEHREAA
jgi:hypothetical protein